MAVEIADVMSAFEDFKAANNTKLAELEKHGTASAEAKASADKALAALQEINDAIEAARVATEARVDEIENRLNRPKAGGLRIGDLSEARLRILAQWQAQATQKPVDLEEVDLTLIGNYNNEFRVYMRRGTVGPVLNEMSAGSGPDGGYFVSPDLTGRMVEMTYETSPMRQLADVQVITSDALDGPKDLGEAESGGWVGETAARTDTDTPQIGMWKIPLHEQYAQPRITQKLLDSTAFDVEGWLARKVTAKFSRVENAAYVGGDGIVKPRGFLTYPAGVPSAALWEVIQQIPSGHATTLTATGIQNLIFSLKSYYLAGAAFGMNRLTWAAVASLLDGNGNYLIAPDFSNGVTMRLRGFPMVEMADMPNVSAGTLPIVFGNMRIAYQIVDGSAGVRVLRDPYTSKPFIRYYTTKQTGGDVIGHDAIALQKVAAS